MSEGSERRPSFSIKPVATPDLKPDLSNLDEVNLVKFRQALQGPQSAEIIARTIGALEQVASQGIGVDAGSLPTPLRQSGLECQTMALLNGIQAWEGYQRVRDVVPQIPTIRSRAVARAGDAQAAYSIAAVDQVLKELGMLERLAMPANPIQVARRLFVDHRFMGVSSTAQFHAFSVLPLDRGPSGQGFALKIDSLGGTTTLLSARDFLSLIVSRPLDENQLLYQATKAD